MNSEQYGHCEMNSGTDALTLPVPIIDHVVVNVRETVAQASELYARLGFALTPQGRHTLGSINHLAMFGPDYLELLGVPPGEADRTDVMAWPEGLTGIAFATDDADAVHAALAQAGAPVLPPLAFSRPVTLPGGMRDASFRVVRIAPEACPAGRLFFCHHLTRGVVWRDEWRRHPNGTLGIVSVVIAAVRPEALGMLFRRMFGEPSVVAVPGGLRLLAGLSSIDVVAPAEVARRYGAAAPAMEGREAVMAALVLRSASIARAAAALQAGGVAGVEVAADRVLVPAAAAMGVALEFRAG